MTRTFLETLCADPPDGLCPVLWFKTTGGTKITRPFLTADEGLRYVGDHREEADVYIHVALATVADRGALASGKRITNATARGIIGFGADIDFGKPGGPPTLADAEALAGAMPFAPTLLVSTGRGLHAWWLFKEPWVFDDAEERVTAAALTAAWHGLLHANAAACGWRIDATGDLARVLRVPGTTNRKKPDKPLPVEILRNGGPRINPTDAADLPELEPFWIAAYATVEPAAAETATESSAYGMAALRDEARDLAETAEGNRNNRLNKAAFALGQLIAGGQLVRSDVERALRIACERNGLPTREREATLRSGINAGMKTPRAPETTTETTAWRCTELGMAERFRDAHLDSVRWCADLGRWLVWTGTRWAPDEGGAVLRLAKAAVLGLYAEAGTIEEDKARENFVKFIRACEKANVLRNILSLAESELPLPVRLADFDADGWLLNLENGTLDLRTGALRPHRPADLCMKQAPIAFDPTAGCPLWDAFLERVMGGDQGMIAFLQCAVGACLPAHMREQVLFILHGAGANGKSVFISTMLSLLGTYGAAAEPQTLLARKQDDGIRNDLAALAGKRLVTTSEIGAGKRLDEALVKRLTGSDKITARFLFREHFSFDPTFRVWLATNHRPEIRETTHAIWRRIRLVPFDVTIPDDEQDPDLPEKLRAELPGILNWAIAGCLAWQAEGRLQTPDKVRDETDAYRDESDPLAQFIADRCIIDPATWVRTTHLRGAYESWCREEHEKQLTTNALGRALTERGFVADRLPRAVSANRDRIWKGVGLLE